MSLRPGSGTDTWVNADEARRRREDIMAKIREKKRENNVLKKRMLLQSQQVPPDASQVALNFKIGLESIPALVQGLWSKDPDTQMEATTEFQRLLSIDRRPPINEVIKAGVVPKFVEFLGKNDIPQLQLESAWILTNVACGTPQHTRVLIEHGAVPMFVQLLITASGDLREQAVWALGNIAGDSQSCRDAILGHGALMPLLALLNCENSRLSMLRIATWTLSNLCKPLTPFEKVKPALPVLKQLIHVNDGDVITYACWALHNLLCDASKNKIQALIDSGVCPRLVGLLRHPLLRVIKPAIRILGNIVAGDDAQIQIVIDNGALSCLYQLLTQNHMENIKKQACWVIANISCWNTNQKQAVIEANIIPPLVHLLEHAEFHVKKQAAWAISNTTLKGSPAQIRYLVEQGCIKPLCDLLICPDPMIVKVCLEALENILRVGEIDKRMGMNGGVANLHAQMINTCQGLDKIYNLQTDDDNEIYEKAMHLLEMYWGEEDDELKLVDYYFY